MKWWRRKERERDLERELRSHLEAEAEEQRDRGVGEEEARYAARRALGNTALVSEDVREIWGWMWLERLMQDARYGMRMLRKNPVFASIAILTLGLGIGANTAIFTLINAVMLRSLPVKDPEQLVFFSRSNIEGNDWSSFPYPFYREVRDQNTVFAGVICQSGMAPSLSMNGSSERVTGELVSGNFFEVLGIKPYIGRLFTSDDDRAPRAHPVVVLSYGFWKRRFGSDPSVVGTTIRLNTTPMTVIGVSAPGFESLNLGSSPDIRAPMMMLSEMAPRATPLESRGDWWLRIAGRLKPGVWTERARAAIHLMMIAYMEENNAGHPRTEYEKRRFASERLLLLPAGKGARGLAKSLSRPLFVLMGVVGAVLLIACLNIANLVLARTAKRKREIAVRLALGAARSRLIRQLLTESFLLAILGAVLGVATAYWGAKVLLTLLAPNQVTLSLNITPDYRVLGFTLLTSICATLLVGLAPSWQAVGLDVSPNLKGDTSMLSGLRLSGRKLLVSVQVSLSLTLLIGAGLFLRSLHNLRNIETGFDREDVLQLTMDPTLVGYKAEQLNGFYREVVSRVSALPGVRSASFANIGLLSGSIWGSGIKIEGHRSREGGDPGPDRNIVGPGYFTALRIPILLGRDFSLRDGKSAPNVAIVNEKFAKFYFGNRKPLGAHIGPEGEATEYTVVGVAKDARYAHLREETPRFWYIPYEQFPRPLTALNLYVRTVGDPEKMVAVVRQQIQAIDSAVPVFNIRTLDSQIEQDVANDRFVALLSTFFSALAAILAALGLYGVLAYWVAGRTHEIGIRMALGAERGNVLWLVLREAISLVVTGLAVAIPAALGLTRLIGSMLYGIHGVDRVALVGATSLMCSVALLAGYLPARRATKIDPTVALRYE